MPSTPSEKRSSAAANEKNNQQLLSDIELELKKTELASKKQELKKPVWASPLVLAILAAAFAAFGNAIVAMINGIQQTSLEDRKSEQARILKMLETGNADKAAENLKFLVETGLIESPNYKRQLEAYLASRKPGQGPSLSAPIGTAAKDLTPADIFNDNRRSVGLVVVQSKSPDGTIRETNGTCFIVSKDGYALTVSHIIPDDRRTIQMSVSLGSRASPGVTAEVIKTDNEVDLAIIKLGGNLSLTPVNISNDQILPGDSVIVLGFPGNSELALISGALSTLNEAGGGIGFTAALSPGSSGSPIFNKSGGVIAIVRGTTAGSSQRVIAIPISFARSLLSIVSAH